MSKGEEEKAAEDQQKVISVLGDAKLSTRITHAKQTSLVDFMNNANNICFALIDCPCSVSVFFVPVKKIKGNAFSKVLI